MEHDLPPDQNVYIEDVYGNPSSDTYERLRKWVRHQMKETFLIPLTRKEIVDIKFAGLSAAEKNSIKYAEKRMPPADLPDRIESCSRHGAYWCDAFFVWSAHRRAYIIGSSGLVNSIS